MVSIRGAWALINTVVDADMGKASQVVRSRRAHKAWVGTLRCRLNRFDRGRWTTSWVSPPPLPGPIKGLGGLAIELRAHKQRSPNLVAGFGRRDLPKVRSRFHFQCPRCPVSQIQPRSITGIKQHARHKKNNSQKNSQYP